MRLYEKFGDKEFHTSFATTFGIDFDAYENIVLPRLRGAGCRNNMVIADDRMLTYALNGDSLLPRHAGRLYGVAGTKASGVFHPKIFLQLGRRKGRLIIGSANLTASGLAGNLELASILACGADDSGEQRLIRQAYLYVSGQIENTRALVTQEAWMNARTPWLYGEAASGPEILSDGTRAALLTTGEESGIASRFADLIPERVSRLIVVSPYWDADLQALSYLCERLAPAEVSVLVDPDVMDFPTHAAQALDGCKLYGREGFSPGRFIHAKMLIAQTPSADHVLIGSGNCTVAALGHGSYVGSNEEACLYRRLPPSLLLDELKITEILAEPALDASSLSTPAAAEDLQLDEMQAIGPGRFECVADTLVWRPAPRYADANTKIELLNHNGALITCTLTPLGPSSDANQHFQIKDTEERPAFARAVLAGGDASALAIVSQIDQLRAAMRESQSRRAEAALHALDGETEATLALLEALDVLEKIEQEGRTSKAPKFVPRGKRASADDDPSRHKIMSYEEFVATRRPRDNGHVTGHNSLAGDDASLVRGVLNRIVGLGGAQNLEKEDDDNGLEATFHRGDETANADAAIAAGEEFDTSKEQSPEQHLAEQARRVTAQRKGTKEQVVAAAVTLQTRIKQRQMSGELSNHDMLRLRALLMVICSASYSGKAKGQKLTPLQVLPAEDDIDSWPHVIGRLLFSVFGGKQPAIRSLYFKNEHDQIPDDLIECWATCYWCLQACLNAPVGIRQKELMQRLMRPLAVLAHQLTLPTQAELIGGDVEAVMAAMNARYAATLGLKPDTAWVAHKALVDEMFARRA